MRNADNSMDSGGSFIGKVISTKLSHLRHCGESIYTAPQEGVDSRRRRGVGFGSRLSIKESVYRDAHLRNAGNNPIGTVGTKV